MSTSAISGIIPAVASQTLTLPNGYITSIGYQNSGQQLLVSGIATSGMVFKPGELASGGGLTATIGGVQVAVQVDVKTTYADGSAKMAVLSLARPDIAAGTTVEALLAVAPAGTLSPPALNLDTALAGHSFTVDITTAGVTSHVDVLAALHDALAHGTASFWQSGALASQAQGVAFWPQVSHGDTVVTASPVGIVWPVLALAGFLILVRGKVAGLGGGPVAAEKLRRYGAMWQAVYAAAWLLAAGLPYEAAGMAVLAVVGLVAMTVLKEVNGLSGRPIGWR